MPLKLMTEMLQSINNLLCLNHIIAYHRINFINYKNECNQSLKMTEHKERDCYIRKQLCFRRFFPKFEALL